MTLRPTPPCACPRSPRWSACRGARAGRVAAAAFAPTGPAPLEAPPAAITDAAPRQPELDEEGTRAARAADVQRQIDLMLEVVREALARR